MLNFRKLRKTGGSTLIITLPKKWVKKQKIKSNQELEIIFLGNNNLLLNPHQSQEFRKIQKIGGTSSIISLPKKWILANSLKEHNEIALISQDNGMILIDPKLNIEKQDFIKKISLNPEINPNLLLRLIIGSYVTGYSMINICSITEIDSKFRDIIIQFIKMTIGMDIVEESIHEIKLQERVNIDDNSFNKGIIRMEILVRSMIKDLIVALNLKKPQIIEKIILRDEEINKFHRLVRHQMNRLINKSFSSQNSNLTIKKLKNNFLLSQNIERIGDHTANIGRFLMENFEIIRISISIDKFSEICDFILTSMCKSILSWRNNDFLLANNIIENSISFITLYDSFLDCDKLENYHYSILLIREEFNKLHLLIRNIAEIVINSSIQ